MIKFLSSKKQKKYAIKQEEQSKIQEYINSFIFSEDSFNVNFFYNLAKTKHNAVKKSKFVVIEHPDSRIILYPHFTYKTFCIDDVINIINKVKTLNTKRIVICTNKYDTNVPSFIKKLPIEIYILDGTDTYYELLKKYNCFPQPTKLEQENKITLKELASFALNKKRTKGYFISSIFLLFSSFFVPFKLYYIIISTILLILALVSFINPKFNKKTNIELLS